MQNIATLLYIEKKFYAIEIGNQERITQFIEVVKKNNALSISKSFNTTSIQLLKEKKIKQQPVSIVVNNNQVISKTITLTSSELSQNQILNQAFPNINLNEFCFNILRQKKHAHISICRSNYLYQVINQLETLDFGIKSIFLGNLIAASMMSSNNNLKLYSSDAVILCENDQILEIKTISNQTEINQAINGLDIKNTELLAFASIIGTLNKPYGFYQNLEDICENKFKQFRTKLLTKSLLKQGLILIFSMLLINFLIFNHYFNKVNLLSEKRMIYDNTLNQISSLKEKINTSEKLLSQLESGYTSKSVYYLNNIIASAPEDLLLHLFRFQPITKKIKVDKPIEFESDLILIQGITHNNLSFLNWVNEIDSLAWVEKCEVTNYTSNNASSSNFELKIILNEGSE
jgi:hypothetical protein